MLGRTHPHRNAQTERAGVGDMASIRIFIVFQLRSAPALGGILLLKSQLRSS